MPSEGTIDNLSVHESMHIAMSYDLVMFGNGVVRGTKQVWRTATSQDEDEISCRIRSVQVSIVLLRTIFELAM